MDKKFRVLSAWGVFLCFSLICFPLVGCAPKIYVIDQHTVFEQEAAGEWPEFDRELLRQAAAATPVEFPNAGISPKKARLFQVLNGEVTTETAKSSR